MEEISEFGVFLMVEGVTDVHDVLRGESDEYHIHKLTKSIGEGWLVRKNPKATLATWNSFVQSVTDDSIPDFVGQSNSAIIILQVAVSDGHDRLMVVSFGQGDSFVEKGNVEYDFGKNVVSKLFQSQNATLTKTSTNDYSGSVRSVDTADISGKKDAVQVPSRSEVAKAATISYFDNGTLWNARYSGAKVYVKSTNKFNSNQLLGRLERLLAEYFSDKQGTEFLERHTQIKDPSLKKALFSQVLMAGNLSRIGIDFELDIATSPDKITFNKRQFLSVNDLAEYVCTTDFVPAWMEYRVVLTDSSGEGLGSVALKNIITVDLFFGGNRYILQSGKWFKVSEKFLETLEKDLADVLSVHPRKLPEWSVGENEDDYNHRLVQSLPNAVEIHKKNYASGDGKIEIADILDSNHRLYFVKKWHSSSVISHLGQQAQVTTRFIGGGDEGILQILNDFCNQRFNQDGFDKSNATIVFVIGGKLKLEDLPLFTKISLADVARDIKARGFSVEVAFVAHVQNQTTLNLAV